MTQIDAGRIMQFRGWKRTLINFQLVSSDRSEVILQFIKEQLFFKKGQVKENE